MWWIVPLAWASDPAEYQRLSGEIERLAARGAWVGVERQYGAAIATGAPATFAVQLAGATAAWERGDVQAARDRLASAAALREDRDVIEWLWRIDTSTTPVVLQGPPGHVLRRVDATGFDPEADRAVVHANAMVGPTGRFVGRLPRGDYAWAGRAFTVGARPVRTQVP